MDKQEATKDNGKKNTTETKKKGKRKDRKKFPLSGIIVGISVALYAVTKLAFGFSAFEMTLIRTVIPPRPTEYKCYVYNDFASFDNRYPDVEYMGGIEGNHDSAINFESGSKEKPKFGSTCIAITYTPQDAKHWAGMMWLSGKESVLSREPREGVDVGFADRLEFWAKGKGSVKFFIEDDRGMQESISTELAQKWVKYTIPFPETWNEVVVGFGWASNYANTDGQPITFYVDDIVFRGILTEPISAPPTAHPHLYMNNSGTQNLRTYPTYQPSPDDSGEEEKTDPGIMSIILSAISYTGTAAAAFIKIDDYIAKCREKRKKKLMEEQEKEGEEDTPSDNA